MQLQIAGGCGEHGRNCFLVTGKHIRFLVDCGIMNGKVVNPYPELMLKDIPRLQYVFLTHSHLDHSGALTWLIDNGFKGKVIASRLTFEQLLFVADNKIELEDACPNGVGLIDDIQIHWGRSGHCIGSVWFLLLIEGRSILFSGDYTEQTQLYACDPLRNVKADVAILDCAYGYNNISYEVNCKVIVNRVLGLLEKRVSILFPVPEFGRGLELFCLFLISNLNSNYYADSHYIYELSKLSKYTYWLKNSASSLSTMVQHVNCMKNPGIIFVSDTKLKSSAAKRIVNSVIETDGISIMTGGKIRSGSYLESLYEKGYLEYLRYPVHQNFTQCNDLKNQNEFKHTIYYHSEDISKPDIKHF